MLEGILILMMVLLFLSMPVGIVLLCISLFPATMDPSVPANYAFVGRVLAILQAPQMVAAWVGGLGLNKVMLLLCINVFLLFVGMIMDTSPAILILTPILLPIVEAVGVHPIHFGITMVVNLAIGFVTPPVGVNLYVAGTLTGIPPMTIAKKALPAMGVFFLALVVITFIPIISLALI